jgi:hypothetical protein
MSNQQEETKQIAKARVLTNDRFSATLHNAVVTFADGDSELDIWDFTFFKLRQQTSPAERTTMILPGDSSTWMDFLADRIIWRTGSDLSNTTQVFKFDSEQIKELLAYIKKCINKEIVFTE